MKESKDKKKSKPKPPIVLELDKLTIRGKAENSIDLDRGNFTLREGEVALLHIDRHLQSREFMSTLEGLIEPMAGETRFRSRSWDRMNLNDQLESRFLIGRVFDENAWIQNLNLSENVVLSMNHRGIPDQEISKDVDRWLEVFEMSKVSRLRPSTMDDPGLLQRHQWLRAFTGNPRLILLERPMKNVAASVLPLLIRAVNRAASLGCAVLWTTAVRDYLHQEFERPIQSLELVGRNLNLMNGAAS